VEHEFVRNRGFCTIVLEDDDRRATVLRCKYHTARGYDCPNVVEGNVTYRLCTRVRAPQVVLWLDAKTVAKHAAALVTYKLEHS